jgi:hypothetical protein
MVLWPRFSVAGVCMLTLNCLMRFLFGHHATIPAAKKENSKRKTKKKKKKENKQNLLSLFITGQELGRFLFRSKSLCFPSQCETTPPGDS